jgi:hypothetical protein
MVRIAEGRERRSSEAAVMLGNASWPNRAVSDPPAVISGRRKSELNGLVLRPVDIQLLSGLSELVEL